MSRLVIRTGIRLGNVNGVLGESVELVGNEKGWCGPCYGGAVPVTVVRSLLRGCVNTHCFKNIFVVFRSFKKPIIAKRIIHPRCL